VARSRLYRALTGAAGDAAAAGTARARGFFRDLANGGRFTCACCPERVFRGYRALNAHHLARHGGYWASDKARKIARKMGKEADAARKHARGWLEAHGYIDHMGRRTAKARSRPVTPQRGHLTLRDLRARHRHDRSHDRAEGKARRAESRAARAAAKGKHARADFLRSVAADARFRHDTAWPQRPAPPRPGPARPDVAASNGHCPEPARTGRTR
jgi:hypothetical protein